MFITDSSKRRPIRQEYPIDPADLPARAFLYISKFSDKIFAADFLKKLQNSEHSSRQFSLLVFLPGTWYSPDKDIRWIRRGFDEKRSWVAALRFLNANGFHRKETGTWQSRRRMFRPAARALW